jgi:DNA-binding transcriptional regulator YdaS (Cro superfamily)
MPIDGKLGNALSLRAMSRVGIQKAHKIMGGTTAVAEALGVKPPTVSQWVSGQRPVPPRFCRQIEAATEGEVTCHDLRPDIFGPAPKSDRKRVANA